MYSGSDSTESANYGQWPLNPTFFQNMPNEQVDWAALAQQWIQMKEAGPPIPEPKSIEKQKENNGKDKDITLPSKSNDGVNSTWKNAPSSCETFDNSWNWKAQPNWDWNNTWNPQLNNSVGAPPLKPTLLPTPKTSSSMDISNDNSSLNPGYSTSRGNDFTGGYNAHSANHSRHYKPHNRRYSKVNVPKTAVAPQAAPVSMPNATPDLETSSLDANKRKQLPAWIREGLEKMERDKQRQIEKEKEREKHNIYTEKIKEQEKKTMEILKDTIKERRRSKFDSDEEQSPKRLEEPIEKPAPLSHDQLMLLVRRKMTEILLKVTNEAIYSICTEERQRFMKKVQTSSRYSGQTLVSEKLGLAMYGSDSGSETEDSEISQRNSDDELKSTIRKRKADFVQTEKGIEDKLFQAGQKKGNSKINHDDNDEDSSENQLDESFSEGKREDSNSKNKSNSISKKHQISPPSSDDSDRASSRKKSSSRSRESSVAHRRRKRSRTKDRGYTPEKRSRRKSPRRSRSKSYDRRHSYDYESKKDRSRSERSRRSRSRTSRRSRSRSSSYRSRRSSETSSRSRRKRSRSRNYHKSSRRSRSRSHDKSRTR